MTEQEKMEREFLYYVRKMTDEEKKELLAIMLEKAQRVRQGTAST